MNYREAIDWLYSTQMFGIKLGLEGPTQLLRKFLAFPRHTTKVIQVAGTNGKGSTCAFIDSVARACGVRTGLFTSPHLVDYTERIQVSGAQIPREKCAALATELRALAETLDPHPTFFELTLALAMRHFYEQSVDLIILEVGMGGRLDATTAVPTNASIITPIGLDHTKWLGDTIEKIALEKAGIIREGVPVFSAAQEPDAVRVIREQANEMRAPLEFVTQPTEGYPIGLPGQHQKHNASLALAALHALHYPLSFDSVHGGLGSATHAGRFQILRPQETSRTAPLILDAAHNPHAAKSLVDTWRQTYGDKKAALIFGAVADKDIASVLEQLAPITDDAHLVPVNSERGLDPANLAATAEKYDIPSIKTHPSLEAALTATAKNASHTLLTGSLFLIGEALAHLQGELHHPSSQ